MSEKTSAEELIKAITILTNEKKCIMHHACAGCSRYCYCFINSLDIIKSNDIAINAIRRQLKEEESAECAIN